MIRAFPLLLALALAPSPLVQAQTCPAVPHLARCAAAAPAPGQALDGPVLQVIDGQTVCVALGPTPDQWVRVTLSGSAGVTRDQLMAAAFARDVECSVLKRGSSSVVAACSADGIPLQQAAAAVPAQPPGGAFSHL